jgi:hypothetical protein
MSGLTGVEISTCLNGALSESATAGSPTLRVSYPTGSRVLLYHDSKIFQDKLFLSSGVALALSARLPQTLLINRH